MNLALFFEGTGQGVCGRKTNVTLVYEACVPDGQLLHLEPGPGTNFGYFLSGAAAGHDWRKIFASARRWFEQNFAHSCPPPPLFSTSPKVFLFGFSRGALLARHFAAWLDKLGIEVEYMGLWDTVDATPDLAVSEECPRNVKFARHAVAEHEARRFFAYIPLRGLATRVEECLFPGVHSDVGGLYEDNHELADAARAWIVRPAIDRGLRLRPDGLPSECVSEKAVRHDSLRQLSNLFGLLRPLKRIFPPQMKRHCGPRAVRRSIAVVSLGSNVEPRAQYLRQAVEALSALPDTRLTKASSVCETEPVDVPPQFADMKFLNQVAVFETRLTPLEFSRQMHGIEDRLGRVRTIRNGPRTIDIDLIDFDGVTLSTPELTLPHPRARERDFVQKPLAELGLSLEGLSTKNRKGIRRDFSCRVK